MWNNPTTPEGRVGVEGELEVRADEEGVRRRGGGDGEGVGACGGEGGDEEADFGVGGDRGEGGGEGVGRGEVGGGSYGRWGRGW